jgi:hypothetical protein
VSHDDSSAGSDRADVVHHQHFDCTEPIEISVELGGGRLDVQLAEGSAGAGTVSVQIRPDPVSRLPWSAGIGGLLGWLGEQTGATAPGELATEATRCTMIDFTGRRLTVRTPRDAPLSTVPLTIAVTAPAGSSVTARSESADITADGTADRFDASTGSGQVRAQRCIGTVDIRTGSGDVRLGSALGALRVRTGSGVVDVIAMDGPVTPDRADTVQTGSGDVRLGAVARNVTARSGSGDIAVVDASAGRLELTSGSGQLRVGIHAGVLAELDVSSGAGQARSDLPVGGPPGDRTAVLQVRARTGSGDALVTSAPA